MAKLVSFTADTSLPFLSHHKFNNNRFFKPSLLNSRSGCSKISCSIKEKENLAERKGISSIISGLRVDGELGEESGSGFGKLGFEKLNLGTWKSVPLRYKLIGTTSLAFVICNMDKVNLGFFCIVYCSIIFRVMNLRRDSW
ncbi:hypothetical protein HanLR1_Chr12g0431671 [Helianthus annuus]|nr:hypothetical protein HanLR1_Chr12g0431671 [Helianthus annuus]